MTPEQVLAQADRVICVGTDPACRPGAMMLQSTDPQEIERWVSTTFRMHSIKVALVMSAKWEGDNPAAAEAIHKTLSERQQHAVVEQSTIKARTQQSGLNYIRNLKRGIPWATSLGQPLKGMPAIVVGAGPSLDRNKHLLESAYGKAAIIATSTAARAVPGPIDAVVCVEGNDVSPTLRARPDAVHVLDLGAHPNCWDTEFCQGRLAFGNENPPTVPYTLQAGGFPISYAAGVSSAAVSLCHFWGASKIILVGMDLSYADDGRCYAEGTLYDDLRVTVTNDVGEFTGSSKEKKPLNMLKVLGWGGRTVTTDYVLYGYTGWFGCVPGTVNCTEGGAKLPGVPEATLADTLAVLPEVERPRLTVREDEARLLDAYASVALGRMERQATMVFRATDETIHETALACPMLHMWTAPLYATLDTDGGLAPHERGQRVIDGMRQGAADILEALG